jgi:hypothetical protein
VGRRTAIPEPEPQARAAGAPFRGLQGSTPVPNCAAAKPAAEVKGTQPQRCHLGSRSVRAD